MNISDVGEDKRSLFFCKSAGRSGSCTVARGSIYVVYGGGGVDLLCSILWKLMRPHLLREKLAVVVHMSLGYVTFVSYMCISVGCLP